MTRIVVVELFNVTNYNDTFNQVNYRKSKVALESAVSYSNGVKIYSLGKSLFIQEL